MKPVIAIVGRPNVGKSTLFNRLTRRRDAIVADEPGVTRDRQYGNVEFEERQFIAIDTGGLSGDKTHTDDFISKHVQLALDEADHVFFIVDGRGGLTSADEEIAKKLRSLDKKLTLVVNKTDGINEEIALADFYALGFAIIFPIAASHGRGVTALMQHTAGLLDEHIDTELSDEEAGIKVAIVGKPNVGKSTLVNRILGEERVLVIDAPGTTRDSVFIPFERRGERYTLIDTAGVRRRANIHETVEKFSVVKALQAIDSSNVVVMVIDARDNVSDQDLRLLRYILDSGRSLVLAVNKWDDMSQLDKGEVRRELDRRLGFVDFAKMHFISALHGSNVGDLFGSILEAYASAMIEMNSARLTRILEKALDDFQPPLVRGRRIKLRFAHPHRTNPPTIMIHGNQTDEVPESYKRYLVNTYRKALKIVGTPIRLAFKTGENPYEGRAKPKKTTLSQRRSASKGKQKK